MAEEEEQEEKEEVYDVYFVFVFNKLSVSAITGG